MCTYNFHVRQNALAINNDHRSYLLCYRKIYSAPLETTLAVEKRLSKHHTTSYFTYSICLTYTSSKS